MGAIRTKLTDVVALSRAVMNWPVFSRTSYGMVSELSRQGIRPRTIIDVGANKGQFAIAALWLLRPDRLHSFEPLPDVGEVLERTCSGYEEVVIHRFALGSAEGTATLHVNAHNQSSSLLRLGERHRRAFPKALPVDSVEVEVQRLDAVMADEALASPVLMKIDAQGYEAEVLKGATGILDKIDQLVIETSFTPLYEHEMPFLELLDLINSLGFRFDRPVGSLKDPTNGQYLQMDALFSQKHA